MRRVCAALFVLTMPSCVATPAWAAPAPSAPYLVCAVVIDAAGNVWATECDLYESDGAR